MTHHKTTSASGDSKRILINGVAVAAALIVFVFLLAQIAFGGVHAGLAWAKGHVVFVDPIVAELEISAGDSVPITFHLRRLVGKPVTVVGATPGCGCVVVRGLPLELGPADEEVTVTFLSSEGMAGRVVEQNIPLHLSVDSPQVFLSVKARVRDSENPQRSGVSKVGRF